MSKGGFMKDAMILFAITLVSGACPVSYTHLDVYKRQPRE